MAGMRNYKKLDDPNILPFLFRPRSEPTPPPPHGAINADIAVSSEVTIGCRFYLHNRSSPSILYFHGNGETPAEHDMIAPLYNDRGWSLLVVSYRGYGWSTGAPTATALMDDAQTLFHAVRAYLADEGRTGPLFVMGRSLGSASAIEVASNFANDIKGLILESGFSDTLPLLKNLGAPTSALGITERDGFGNREKIAAIKLPTLILLGSRDLIIPPSSADRRRSFSGARKKQFYLVPGADHNSMIHIGGKLYFQTIKNFINDVIGASCWRRRRKKHKRNSGLT